jgi:hypothetical protein
MHDGVWDRDLTVTIEERSEQGGAGPPAARHEYRLERV